MTSTCWYFSVAEMALPWLFVLAGYNAKQTFPFLRSTVVGLVAYQIFLFVTSLTLGHLGMLGGLPYRIIFAAVTVLALGGVVIKLPLLYTRLQALRYRPHWYDIPTVACILRALQLVHNQWFNDWTQGTSGYDGMHYHIPRALQWLWHGDFRAYRTMIWQQLGHPFGGAATLLPSVFNGCGWLGGAYTTLVLSLGASAAVTLISLTFGLGARASILAGLVLFSCPAVGLRAIDISTDIAATFPVIAAVALARTSTSLARALFTFIALVGLGGSIKQYSVFPAIPIGLALFIPSTIRIIKDVRAITAAFAGVLVAFAFIALSMWPIYTAFGDFAGGGTAYSLSNIGAGWNGVRESIVYNFLQWSFEPIALLPESSRRSLFIDLSLDKVWEYFGFPGTINVLLPEINRERMRALMYSILFLPWLIMAVRRGYRILTALGFLLVCCAQFAPLAVNSVGARFTIIVLATYSILWGARATRSPFIIGCMVLITLNADLTYANRGYPLQLLWPSYQAELEVNRDLQALVGSDNILLLGRAMALDAEIAGRLGQIRFEYVACPADGNWVAHFRDLKAQSRWFLMSAPPSEIVPGPDFDTRVGPRCERVYPTVLKEALVEAGWHYVKTVVREYELWTY